MISTTNNQITKTIRPSALTVFSLWAKNKVEKLNHRIVINCCLGGPRNSSFILCSKIQITAPTIRKNAPVTAHICAVNGLKNAQALEYNFLTGATTTSPESV
uniref:Uncharacterized protein n=1 Tax=Opuntia streptacantha TaxID=393608 RepID=A0A7C9DWG7_OPUST